LWAANQKSDIRIPFASAKHAQIAQQAIDVDPELQPHAVHRTLTVEGEVLVA
jgi:EKC/KEOPS complex subunit PCC1/LAGE3